MKSIVHIKDKQIVSLLNLEDGEYRISIEKKCDDKTLDQTRKLWATCSDISEKIYGTKAEKDVIYLQILRMAGQRTYRLTLEEDALEEFKKQKGIKAVSILSRDIINHKPYVYVEVCMSGISEMDKKEVSQVIDACCRYAEEVGVIPQVKDEYGNYE